MSLDNQYIYTNKYDLECEISALYRMAKRLELNDKLNPIGQELRIAANKLERMSVKIFSNT